MSTDLEPTAPSEVTDAQRADLAAGVKQKFEQRDLVLPMLNLTQQLSKAVTAKKVDSGEFINSLTGKVYGEALGLVVVDYFKGRLWTDKDAGRTYATAAEVVPEFWPHPDAGKLFSESPEAEERWREDSNSGVHEWESGPPIQTTQNFVGFVAEEEDAVPVRLSLKSTAVPTARKIITLIQIAREPWSYVFDLSRTEEQNKAGQPYFLARAERGRATTPDEQQKAVELALVLRRSEVVLQGDEEGDEKGPKPEPKEGALEVA